MKLNEVDENKFELKELRRILRNKSLNKGQKGENDLKTRQVFGNLENLKIIDGIGKQSNKQYDAFSPEKVAANRFSQPHPKTVCQEEKLFLEKSELEDPFQYGEYIIDIFRYLRKKEVLAVVSHDFVVRQLEINEKMRCILVDWIVQVHNRFNLSQETLFITVQLIDRFIEKKQIKRKELQLIGVTCLLIASKYEEQCVPDMKDYVHVTDNSCKTYQIRNMECLILNILDFDLSYPIPLTFLRRFTKACKANQKTHNMAKYFMELCLTDSWVSSFCPSFIAAGSLCLAMVVVGEGSWDETLESVSKYKKDELYILMQRIPYVVSRNESFNLKAVTSKYAHKSQGCVSSFEYLKTNEFRNCLSI